MAGNHEQRLRAAERQKQAMQLRLAGASYDDIAARLGFAGRGGAWRAVMSALKQTLQEPADELRKMELERLDRLLLGVWGQAAKGNQGAIDRALKIMERRAKLLGLDAPTKQDLDGEMIITVVRDKYDQKSNRPHTGTAPSAAEDGE